MDPFTIFIIMAFLLIGAVLVFVNKIEMGKFQHQERAQEIADVIKKVDLAANKEWRSVRVSPGKTCCQAAQLLSGKVFLAVEAPPLPLVYCNEEDCRCKYIHMNDRRCGLDRRLSYQEALKLSQLESSERRLREGRRSADLLV